MKGISAVLAMVLIVVITVAIIGLAYGWATGLFELTSEAGQKQVEGITESTQKSVDIVAASCDDTGNIVFTIKNTGTLAIEPDELDAFLNESSDVTVDFALNTDSVVVTEIGPGDSEEFTTTGVNYTDIDAELKIVAPARATTETFTC